MVLMARRKQRILKKAVTFLTCLEVSPRPVAAPARLLASLAQESSEYISRDLGHMAVRKQGRHPRDRSHREYSAPACSLVVDHFGSAVIRIYTLGEKHCVRRRRRAALIRFVAGRSAWDPLMQRLLPEQIPCS